MSRGGKWLCAGSIMVIGSLLAGELIGQAARDSLMQARSPNEAFNAVNQLSPFATIANLAFYGGILAFIIGVVVLVVDSGQRPPAGEVRQSPPFAPAPRTGVEAENERLRAEVERLRREHPSDNTPDPI